MKGSAVTASILTLIKTTLKIMTWTKFKTVAGLGVFALVVGGSTTTIVVHTVSAQTNRAEGSVKAPPFSIAGYGTPEAAIESLVWAFSTGDAENLKAGFTQEEMEKFRSKKLEGKSDEDARRFLIARANAIAGYKITKKEVVSDNEVYLHLHLRPSTELPKENTIIIMKRIGKEWKNAGEMH